MFLAHTESCFATLQSLVWAHTGGAGGERHIPPFAAWSGLLWGLPVQHSGLEAGCGQNAPWARGGWRHCTLLPTAGPQSIVLCFQVSERKYRSQQFIGPVLSTVAISSVLCVYVKNERYSLWFWSNVLHVSFSKWLLMVLVRTKSFLWKWEANIVTWTEQYTIPANQHIDLGTRKGAILIGCWPQILTIF